MKMKTHINNRDDARRAGSTGDAGRLSRDAAGAGARTSYAAGQRRIFSARWASRWADHRLDVVDMVAAVDDSNGLTARPKSAGNDFPRCRRTTTPQPRWIEPSAGRRSLTRQATIP